MAYCLLAVAVFRAVRGDDPGGPVVVAAALTIGTTVIMLTDRLD